MLTVGVEFIPDGGGHIAASHPFDRESERTAWEPPAGGNVMQMPTVHGDTLREGRTGCVVFLQPGSERGRV